MVSNQLLTAPGHLPFPFHQTPAACGQLSPPDTAFLVQPTQPKLNALQNTEWLSSYLWSHLVTPREQHENRFTGPKLPPQQTISKTPFRSQVLRVKYCSDQICPLTYM